MRIHLPLHPSHFAPSAGPLARIGGELVVIELQGELEWEGDKSNGVVGVLGLDRADRPTLHIGEHHLLHGKMATLPKPYAVIRKAQGSEASESNAHALEGDVAEEESDEEREKEEEMSKKRKVEEEDEEPLFPDAESFATPKKSAKNAPPLPPGTASTVFSSPPRDYSSDLSSPPGPGFWAKDDGEDEDNEPVERAQRRAERRERRRMQEPRARYYEVVAVVRKKVVFALRPEPLVAATQLPE